MSLFLCRYTRLQTKQSCGVPDCGVRTSAVSASGRSSPLRQIQPRADFVRVGVRPYEPILAHTMRVVCICVAYWCMRGLTSGTCLLGQWHHVPVRM